MTRLTGVRAYLAWGLVAALGLGFIAYLAKYAIAGLTIYALISGLFSLGCFALAGYCVFVAARSRLRIPGLRLHAKRAFCVTRDGFRDCEAKFKAEGALNDARWTGRKAINYAGVLVLISLVPILANSYVLYLLGAWAITPPSWLLELLTGQRFATWAVLTAMAHGLFLVGAFLIGFLDDWLKALFHFDSRPVVAFFQGAWSEIESGFSSVANSTSAIKIDLPGLGEIPVAAFGKFMANISLGVLTGILSTLIVDRIRSKD